MEPNNADPHKMELFIDGLANLYIAQYRDDLPLNEPGYFNRNGEIDADQKEVEAHFLENWFEYTPSKNSIVSLLNETIGQCRHLFTLIIPLDHEFQQRVCRRVGDIYTSFVADIIDEDDLIEEMDVDEEEPYPAYNPLHCFVHTHPPVIPKFEQFCKEFTSRMFGNFLRGVPFQRKKTLFKAAHTDINETLAENALNLEYQLNELWEYLQPTPCQIRGLVHNVYGFQYKLMQNHIIRHEESFRYMVSHQLRVRIRQYLLQHANIFDETK